MALVRDTPAITDQAYRDAAMRRIITVVDVALPPAGQVDRTMGGAYVAAWVWVPAEAALATEQKEAA